MTTILFDSYANRGSVASKSTGQIDLKGLPIPDIVQTLNYDDILNEMFKRLIALMPELKTITASDPVYKILEVCAYRETLLRARVNESVKAMLLSSAKGKDLDNIAANFNIKRKTSTNETDEELRRRVQLTFDGFTTAGSEASYLFHTLNADEQVRDAYVRTGLKADGSVDAGIVEVFLLLTPPTEIDPKTKKIKPRDKATLDAIKDKVLKHLSAETVRPLTDKVKVDYITKVDITKSGGIIEAELKLFSGVTKNGLVDRAKANLVNYINENQKIGYDIAISGIYKALHVTGVESVKLISPKSDYVITSTQVAVIEDKEKGIKISIK